jgi:hypothetical protein
MANIGSRLRFMQSRTTGTTARRDHKNAECLARTASVGALHGLPPWASPAAAVGGPFSPTLAEMRRNYAVVPAYTGKCGCKQGQPAT